VVAQLVMVEHHHMQQILPQQTLVVVAVAAVELLQLDMELAVLAALVL
jgi:hypothetical protein